ncbi:MAG: PQQ-binding-like beta-propeller repeat protein, partial [Planctomycetes bacterium]|nr:PQQ-binding-like beta-propeller repeat protein [Planctomycetota bacterium]
SELSEIHSALKEIEELESDNAGAEAPKNLAGAIKVQVDRVIRAYRTLLGMSGHAQEVLEVGENPDEEWKNVWLLLRRDLQKSMPRGSELEKAWHEAFNVDAEVAFEAALEVRDLAALMLVGVRYPFAPAALRATKASADLAFAEGQRALAAKGYSALMALEPFQSVSRQDLALAAIKGYLCTRELGWRKAEGEFKSWIDANPAAAVLWGEERKPIGALLLDFEKAIPSFDTLELQLGESLVSMPMATLAGQPSKAEPKNLETQAWPSLKIKGPLSPRTSYAMKNLLEVEVSPVIPTVTPTSILVNTGEALYGFDFLSGKSLWGDGVRLEAPRDAFHYSEQDPNLILTAARWQDLVIAPLENPLSKSTDAPKAKSSFGGSVFSHFPVVRRALVGVDQASGNILWTLGGQYRLRSDQASLPDLEKRIAVTSFFTLTVVDDVIYALGTTRENESQLHLVAIDPAQGKPMWSVLLGAGQGESNMFGNPMRDAMPGIPVVAEGVLYVQSNLGAVMAVEIASQRVLWVSRYEALPRPFTRIRSTAYRKVTHANGAPILTRDKKGNLLLIVAPTDSRFITAFDAESGEVRWRTQTENAQ